MGNESIKSCPYCGSKNVEYEFSGSQGYIKCNKCEMMGPCIEKAADPYCEIQPAIDAWNQLSNKKSITELVKKAHENAVNKGFYESPIYGTPGVDDKNVGELLMLITSELGEALEAHRKGNFTKFEYPYNLLSKEKLIADLQSKDKNRIASDAFESIIKDTFEDELADVAIRLFDLCGYLNIDLERHIELKMGYNATREYKHGKRY